MGLDADLNKYKVEKVSKIDRENYLDWREHYYCYVLNDDKEKWKKFEQCLFYTDDYLFNQIIIDSIKETTGDDYCEEGASLFNLDSLKLAIRKLQKTIKLGYYDEYIMNTKSQYEAREKELNKLLEILDKELENMVNNNYTYLYHATY